MSSNPLFLPIQQVAQVAGAAASFFGKDKEQDTETTDKLEKRRQEAQLIQQMKQAAENAKLDPAQSGNGGFLA